MWPATERRQEHGHRLLDTLGSLFFPPLCPVTGEAVREPGSFSPRGWASLAFVAPPGCELCGAPFEHPRQEPLCASCAAPHAFPRNLCGPKRLDAVRSALHYDEISAQLVLSLKYGDRHDLAPGLGRMLALALQQLPASPEALLVPVPLHPARLKMRRFNQAALLADALGRTSQRSVARGVLRRIKPTPQQKGLGFDARFRNLSGAFMATSDVKGAEIVLVDDVLTSGATLVLCARALRRAGAAKVLAVTVARVFAGGRDNQMDFQDV